MRNRSVRFKLTLTYALLLTVLVLVSFLIMRMAASSVLQKTTREYLVAAVEENTDEARFITNTDEAGENALLISYDGGYLAIGTRFLNVINDVYIALYDGNGNLLYGESPLAEVLDGKPISTASLYRKTIGEERFDIYERPLSVAGTDGLWLRGILSLSSADDQLKDMTTIMLILLPGLIILTVILSFFLAGRLLRPIQQLQSTAAEITESRDLKKRIALSGPRDELHELADTFDAMMERLDQSFEAEKRFTSDASHELRTPTSVIMAQCEYTLDKERTTAEYEDALRTIRRQGARMSGLIGDMLEYTRMSGQSGRYPLSEIDFSTLATDVCNDLSLLHEKNITLQADIEKNITVFSHAQLLTRLLQNLIMNAYRYGNEDGHINVTLCKQANDAPAHANGAASCIQLIVCDDGQGIDAKDLPFIFERFYRSDKSRSTSGTGLGLSIVHQICELHHATIDVTSTLGKGSVFTVSFPGIENVQSDR